MFSTLALMQMLSWGGMKHSPGEGLSEARERAGGGEEGQGPQRVLLRVGLHFLLQLH